MKKFNLHLLTALAVIAFLAACIDHFDPPANGMGRVTIHIADTEARTLLPDVGEITSMALEYRLTIAKEGTTTPAVNVTLNGKNWVGDLESGNYTVEITALKSGTLQTVALGNKEFTVNKNTASSVSVTLTTTQQGNGVFSYSINIPGNVTVTGGDIQLVSLSGGTDPALIILTSNNMSGNINIASGHYRINLSLANLTAGLVKTYETTAVAYITDSLTTTAMYNVTGDDFVQRDDVVTNSTELNAALDVIKTKPAGEYVITAVGTFSSAPIDLSTGLLNKTITLRGIGSTEITLSSSGSLFTVGNRVTLILENITLRGINNNYYPLVRVDYKLVLRNGGKITGNTTSGYYNDGGGVYVSNGNTLEIAGGEISYNTLSGTNNPNNNSKFGGGVYIYYGNLIMTGGIIKGNKVISANMYAFGGGVYFEGGNNGRFDMNGGVIEGNTAEGTQAYGGGISIGSGIFEMLNGTIENNAVYARGANNYDYAGGGGVNLRTNSPGSFNFMGGKIRNNSCDANGRSAYGGGISINSDGSSRTISMSGGVVNGNTCTSSAYSYGGGIGLQSGSFVKTGGIIYGNDVTGNDSDGIPLKNTAMSSGQAVYYNTSRERNSTAYESHNMDTSISGSAGGWE